MINISKGKKYTAQKVVIYGPEGIGKTTLASQFPEPVFIDIEGGSNHLDVSRIEDITDWRTLLSAVHAVSVEKPCRTLVIDTADWAEQMCVQELCQSNGWTGIETPGYGKGYTFLSEKFADLLKECNRCIAEGIHVVFTAHAKMRKFEQPDEAGAYDRWEMKMSKNVAPLLKEWCDLLLFCNYKTLVITTENSTKKATGGKRVMYASHHPCWDAKNRCGLPDKMDLDYSCLAKLFDAEVETEIDYLKASLVELMNESGVTEADVQEVYENLTNSTVEKGTSILEYTKDDYKRIVKNWNTVLKRINKSKEDK